MSKKIKAWHFTGSTLRDGRPIPAIGEKLIHEGALALCELGLHSSEKILDALTYAPGEYVHRVVSTGDIIEAKDKLVSSERTIVWSLDATEVLRRFARLCALDVIHLWDAPAVVVQYLRTGAEDLRVAARATAWDAARDGASSAAWDAARAALWAAARQAARDASWDATWAAARDAAQAALWAAARDAAQDASWAAVRDAVWDASWAAARDAVRKKQNKRLTRIIYEARRAA